jgi:hypothetical protein
LQREESMKRLLEWKQRMLQSPLTRKPTSGPGQRLQPANADLANCYKQQALLELAAHEASLAEQAAQRHSSRRRDDAHHRPHHPRSKSTDGRRTAGPGPNSGPLHHGALPRYNSYSSDDEGKPGRSPPPPTPRHHLVI